MNKEQKKKMTEAIGGSKDWPKITNDPEINYEIDRLICDPELLPWDKAENSLRKIYTDEVEAMQKHPW